ncbi:endolytic transglycosylase MltG [Candidatus Azambacteria bacterium]|nr:endolytic transglycosylase MltG [Candidatus Azambacteria bacterium]
MDLRTRLFFPLFLSLLVFLLLWGAGIFFIVILARPVVVVPPRPEVTLTFPEGFASRDIAARLTEAGLPGEEFLGLVQLRRLAGRLFPDTYRFFLDSSAEDIVSRFLANFERQLTPELRAEILRQGKTAEEVLTMASLIEKEVRGPTDRAIVSGILWKRLALGIPLQVDATLAYITGKKDTRFSQAETRIESPYNTYLYLGLPPGPIANPGFESIQAALYPAPSPYLYYLSAKDGTTIFSRTLQEHNLAKARYLQ